MWNFESISEEQTAQIGRALGEVLEPGAVIALVGNLGAGKTRLVQGIAEGLGVPREEVNSPTFVLIQQYAGRLPVYHFDTYRLRDTDEFEELGIDEIFASGGIAIIEWADRVADALPRDHLRIEIEITAPTARVFHVTPTGSQSEALVQRLGARLAV